MYCGESASVQLIPSGLYTRFLSEFPYPPATHREPFHATVLHAPPANTVEGEGVQLIPSGLYASLLVPFPPATHNDPFHAIQFPPAEGKGPGWAVQLIPSGLVAIELLLGSLSLPIAIHIDPFQARPFAITPLNGSEVRSTRVQLIPSELYAIVGVAIPTC